jgi:hypothetical protein
MHAAKSEVIRINSPQRMREDFPQDPLSLPMSLSLSCLPIGPRSLEHTDRAQQN